MNEKNTNTKADANRDPITGTPGSHPIGTTVGAVATGAAAGAAGGALGGPVGAVAGAAVGAVVGGLAGKAAGEALNPTIEAKYWQENYSTRPYAQAAVGYDQYAPAYRYGWESYSRRGADGRTFESIEADLARGWDNAKGESRLAWDQAKVATRDAWARVGAACGAAPCGPAKPNAR